MHRLLLFIISYCDHQHLYLILFRLIRISQRLVLYHRLEGFLVYNKPSFSSSRGVVLIHCSTGLVFYCRSDFGPKGSEEHRDLMSGYGPPRSPSKGRGRRDSTTHKHRGDDLYTSNHDTRLQSLPIRSRSQDGRLNDTRHSTTSSLGTKSYGPSASRTARYGLASSQPLGATENLGHESASSLPGRSRRASISSREDRQTIGSRPSVTSITSRGSSANDSLIFPMVQSSGSSSRASLSSRRVFEDESRGRSLISGRSRAGASARRASSSSGDVRESSSGSWEPSTAYHGTPPRSKFFGTSTDSGSNSRGGASSRSASASEYDWQSTAAGRLSAGHFKSGSNASLHQRRPSIASNLSNPFSGPGVDILPRRSSVRRVEHDPQLFPGTGWTPEFENNAWEDWKADSALRVQRADYKEKDGAATKSAKSYRDDFVDASSVSSSAGLGKSASTDLSASSLDRGALRPLLPKRNMDVQQRKSTA